MSQQGLVRNQAHGAGLGRAILKGLWNSFDEGESEPGTFPLGLLLGLG